MAKKASQPVVLSVSNLTKTFGEFTAVSNVSFEVKKGEIVGLLGPNGAGKTTTIQMLLSLMSPTSGEINYFGKSLGKNRSAIMQRINHTSGYAKMPWRLTVWENLMVFAHLYEVKSPKQKIESLCTRFESMDLLHQKMFSLSAGQTTRVMLVKAFLNDPEVVLLDEPTASLDPDIAEKIREFILEERERRQVSLLITSHNMTEVEEMCDRVVFLSHGKVYAEDTPEGLAKRNQLCELKLMVTDGLKRTIEVAKAENVAYEEKNRFITLKLREDQIGSILTTLGKRGIEYSDIDIMRPSLEDFFLSVSVEK